MVAFLLGVTISFAQDYQRNGKEFSPVKKERSVSASEDVKTGYTYKDSKGKVYDIYMSKKGACYIIRTSSKTGNQYKSYLPKGIQNEIKNELRK